MIKLGSDNIVKAMAGDKEVVRAFLGNQLTYWTIPSAYQRIEYLGANGNNWIATGITANISNTEMEFEGDGFTNVSAQIMVARSSTSGFFRIVKFSADQKIGGTCGMSRVTSSVDGRSVFTARINKDGFWLGNTLVGTFTLPSTIPSLDEVDIFRGVYGGTAYYTGAGNVRKAIIRKNGNPVFYGIPCRRKSDSVLGLYDVVSGTFFTNSGSGSFTPGPDVDVDYSKMYFTIESLEDSNAISIQNVNCNTLPTFSYSTDNGQTWSSVTMTKNGTQNIATIDTGNKVLFKGTNNNLALAYNQYNKFNGSKTFKAYGNVMSLLNGDNFKQNGEFSSTSQNNLIGLFYEVTTLTDASNLVLPALSLKQSSYNGMFRGCSGLTNAPELPATTLAKGCYSSMFEGCINLDKAPELPATTLADECYQRMFCMDRNSKLTTPKMTKSPILRAAYIGGNAYKEMFKGNGNLIEVTCLATSGRGTGTSDWLLNVSSTGVFRKDSSVTWDTGTSHIPSGWTVEDYNG